MAPINRKWEFFVDPFLVRNNLMLLTPVEIRDILRKREESAVESNELMRMWFTLASDGFRHVAKIYLDGFEAISNCLTKPKPRPRLQPVIKIEDILFHVSKLCKNQISDVKQRSESKNWREMGFYCGDDDMELSKLRALHLNFIMEIEKYKISW